MLLRELFMVRYTCSSHQLTLNSIFRSLAGQGELTLPDGRRVCKTKQRHGDIVVHPNFRLILLANRPGYRKRILSPMTLALH